MLKAIILLLISSQAVTFSGVTHVNASSSWISQWPYNNDLLRGESRANALPGLTNIFYKFFLHLNIVSELKNWYNYF